MTHQNRKKRRKIGVCGWRTKGAFKSYCLLLADCSEELLHLELFKFVPLVFILLWLLHFSVFSNDHDSLRVPHHRLAMVPRLDHHGLLIHHWLLHGHGGPGLLVHHRLLRVWLHHRLLRIWLTHHRLTHHRLLRILLAHHRLLSIWLTHHRLAHHRLLWIRLTHYRLLLLWITLLRILLWILTVRWHPITMRLHFLLN